MNLHASTVLYYGTNPVPIINPAINSKKPIGVKIRFQPFFTAGIEGLFVELVVLLDVVLLVVVVVVVVFAVR